MDKPLQVFGDPVDEGALIQIKHCLEDDRAVAGALMADHHLGYSTPIGGVVAYQDAISPSGVGFDIACGNKAVRTGLTRDHFVGAFNLRDTMERIRSELAFGMGRKNANRVDHALFDSEVWDAFGDRGADLKKKAREQLGTIGSGNHYVDLLVDEDDYIWVACHFGSRGFGHTICTWFLAVAAGKNIGDPVKQSDDPAMLDINTAGGDLYVESMKLAGQYAYAGRDYVVSQVLRILSNPEVTESVHCHHNYAWLEDGLWVVRKGATPLTHESAFIGGSMGDVSVIVRGRVNAGLRAMNVFTVVGDDELRLGVPIEDIGALGSAPHGAGRTMSRTAAAGKWKKVNEQRTRPDGSTYQFKRRFRDPDTAAVDWPAVKRSLDERGIVVLGSGADEAPEVYKDLRSVLACHENIEIEHTLTPIGVVMAGDDVVDPYKD